MSFILAVNFQKFFRRLQTFTSVMFRYRVVTGNYLAKIYTDW